MRFWAALMSLKADDCDCKLSIVPDRERCPPASISGVSTYDIRLSLPILLTLSFVRVLFAGKLTEQLR